jgi:hypothetical protein
MQLMQAADSISTCAKTSSANTSSKPDSSEQSPQQQEEQQQELPLEQERFTVVTLRNFLQNPHHMQTLLRMGSATVEDLAGKAGATSASAGQQHEGWVTTCSIDDAHNRA